MKTHGICNAQSARKHRRAGHFVIPQDGSSTFAWGITGDAIPPIECGVDAGEPEGDQTAFAMLPDPRVIRVGASYWPKRRNQHSKPYHVLDVGNGKVVYSRVRFAMPQQMEASEFLALIGKEVRP